MEDLLELKNRHTGEILRMRRTYDTDGQIVLIIDGSLPPHSSGPPAHIHFHQREEGTVKAGQLGAQIGKEKFTVPTGGSVAFNAGIVHNWWNAGDDLLELSGRSTPAVDLDSYLQAVFAVINDGSSGRPSIFYMAHVMWRHRHTQAITLMPLGIQRILFPIILVIGRALGKYRGTAWPGSPESCPGAPLSA